MSKRNAPNQFGSDLCEALGLNPDEITALRINAEVDETRITVDRIATALNYGTITRRYRLVEAPWAPPWAPPAQWAATRPQLGQIYYRSGAHQ